MTECPKCKIRSEKYCPECGVKYLGYNSTIKSLFREVLFLIVNLDNSVFGTLIRIIRDPKKVTELYYKGYRGFNTSPIKLYLFTFLIITLYVLLIEKNSLFGLTLNNEHINLGLILIVFILPFLLMLSNIIFYWQKIPIAKQLISLAYATNVGLLVAILFNLLFFVFFDITLSIGLTTFTIVTYFIHSFTISTKKIIFKILNFILMLIITSLFFTVLSMFL